jgi:hypothetical protein
MDGVLPPNPKIKPLTSLYCDETSRKWRKGKAAGRAEYAFASEEKHAALLEAKGLLNK